MENIKILARPEAYRMLTNPSECERLNTVVAEAIKIAQCHNGKKRKLAHPAFTDCLLVMRWADSPEKESVILISSFQEKNLFNLLDSNQLELAIREGTQIPFF
jgi:hypothetical protein